MTQMRLPAFLLSLLSLCCCASFSSASIVFCDATTHSLTNQSQVITNTVTRDTSSSDTLYFSVEIEPTTDFNGENYFGGLEFYSGATNTFSLGNNWTAFAWSTYGSIGDNDLNSANPETGQVWQLVDATDGPMKIAFKVDYNSAGNDTLTVWLDPVEPGLETDQTANLTTTLMGDFSFDTIQARIGNDGASWDFSNIKVATEFMDVVGIPEPSSVVCFGTAIFLLHVRRRNKSR